MIGFSDHRTGLVSDVGELFLTHTQDLPDDFLAWCAAARDASSAPAGDTHLLYSVPTAICEEWLRDGFDIYVEPAYRVIARLKREGREHFICSRKTL